MRSHLCLTLTLVVVIPSIARPDDLDELIRRVPGGMNTVAVVNVREINRSPRAVRENWGQIHETEYLAGAMAVPNWVPLVVIGAEVQPGWLSGGRSIALIPTTIALNSSVIARREGGVVQTVDDMTLVLSPQRGYFGFPSANVLGVSATMPRQEFARWVRLARRPDKPAISDYLQKAVTDHKDAHVVVAADLQDMIDPSAIRATIQLAGLTDRESQVDALVRALTGVRGLVFTAQIADRSPATLKIDFAVSMDFFQPAFAQLWPKAMESIGLEVEEFRSAVPKVDGRSITMTASLSDSSLRRILSLVHAPGNAVESPDAVAAPTSKDAAMRSASMRYFRAVNQALDDLRGQRQGGAKARDFAQSAVFYDSFATKIERLPLTNVDPVLVSYGMSVSTKLRAMANSMRGVRMQLEAFDNYKSTTWVATPGFGWGGGSTQLNTNVQTLNTRSADLIAQLEPERAKMWNIIMTDRSAVRKEMLDKYMVDFEQFRK